MTEKKKKTIGIYIYDQAEVLDFAGPFEVFSTAGRLLRSRTDNKSAAEENDLDVLLIAQSTDRLVQARGGFPVQATCSIQNHPQPLDVLVVVGGVHMAEMEKKDVTDWIAKQHVTTEITASVCTGAFLLAKAGILAEGTCVTTHWEDAADLQQQFQHLKVVTEQRWVDTGRIVTSGGISAGIDMALHLVRRLYSLELAQSTARQMEFDWTRPDADEEGEK